MLDWLNAAADDAVPVVLNAAAWTHYSYALFDACAHTAAHRGAHLRPDPAARGVPAHVVVTPYATAVVAGHGIDGYRMALEHRRPRLAGGRTRAGCRSSGSCRGGAIDSAAVAGPDRSVRVTSPI